MYDVIAITNVKFNNTYIKMNDESMDIKTARKLVGALPESMDAKIVDDLKTELAITLNNELKGFC